VTVFLKISARVKKPKSKEQELSEEFQAFLEAEFKDTVDKRPSRKGARHSRGHEPKSGYIELQDYRSMTDQEFQQAYRMMRLIKTTLVIQNPKLKQALGIR
jgi:predicted transcriptional regulator